MKKAVFRSLVLAASLALPAAANAASGHGAHWSYGGHEGPEYWGDLAKEYATCKTGHSQSPVNIISASAESAQLPAIEFNYQPATAKVVNNGHTIQVSYPAGSSITLGGKKYELLQFHFHAPSEHQIDGKPGDMVVHLVHKAADGQLGVVGVLMNKGAENPVIGKVFAALPKADGHGHDSHDSHGEATAHINAADLVPAGRSYYNYSGSLTTPPCSEGVNWMVMASPASVSEGQVKTFTELFPVSVRPVQPLHARVIKTSH